MTHEKGTLYWPLIQKIFFNAAARARLRPVRPSVRPPVRPPVHLSATSATMCATLRVLFVARVGRSNDVHGERDGGRAERADGAPRAADEDADVARSSFERARARRALEDRLG